MSEPLLKLSGHALTWSAEDGEVIALDLNDSHYLGINRSGTLLWDKLAGGTTRAHLSQLLETTYGLDTAQASMDVDAFLRSCRARGYLDE